MMTLTRPIAAIARNGTERSSDRAWNHVMLRHDEPIAPGAVGTILRETIGVAGAVVGSSARAAFRRRRCESFSSFTTLKANATSRRETAPHTSRVVRRNDVNGRVCEFFSATVQ